MNNNAGLISNKGKVVEGESRLILVNTPPWNINSPPINISYLKAYALSNGINVEALDLNIDLYLRVKDEMRQFWSPTVMSLWGVPDLWKERIQPYIQSEIDWMVSEIMSKSPTIVGFTVNYSPMLIIELAEKLKGKNPNLIIIVGGQSACRVQYGELFLRSGWVDLCVEGEGELTLMEIIERVNAGKTLDDIPGTLSIIKGLIHANPPRQRIRDIDLLPFPDYSGFDLSKYMSRDGLKKEVSLPILFSRGCPGACDYCFQNVYWGKPFVMRSAENLFEEVKDHVSKYNVNKFDFADLTINGDLKKLERFTDLIISSHLDIEWGGSVIIRKEMSKEILSKMKKAGCKWLSIGLESGSEKVLRSMRKMFTPAQAHKMLKDVFSSGITPSVCLIIGHPEETEQDFKMTVSFLKKARPYLPVRPNVSICIVYPSTALFNKISQLENFEFSFLHWKIPGNDINLRLSRLQRLTLELKNLYEGEYMQMADIAILEELT